MWVARTVRQHCRKIVVQATDYSQYLTLSLWSYALYAQNPIKGMHVGFGNTSANPSNTPRQNRQPIFFRTFYVDGRDKDFFVLSVLKSRHITASYSGTLGYIVFPKRSICKRAQTARWPNLYLGLIHFLPSILTLIPQPKDSSLS